MPNDTREEDSPNSSDLSLSLNTEDNSPELYKEIQQDYNDSKANLKSINLNETSEIDENNKSEERPGEKSPASHSSQKSFLNMMITSSRSINILHTVYVLSILVVIASNIAVLIFAYLSIGFVSKVTFPITVGNLGNYFQLSGYMARMMYTNPSGYTDAVVAMYFGLIGTIDSLEKLYIDTVSNLESWDYCSSKSIFTDKKINLYYPESEDYKNTNLLDTTALFIQNGNELISKFNKLDDFSKEVSFLALNGYGDLFNYCNSSLFDIIECQKSKIDDFHAEMIFLLVLGIIVLATCVAIIAPFCYSTIKIENNFWNKIRKKAGEHYFELTQSSLDRLTRVHDQPEIENNSRSPCKEPFNFKNYWKYIWRIFLYFAVVLAFSFINIFYLYQQCADYLSYRPEIIRELIQLRMLYDELGVWQSEITLKKVYAYDGAWIKYSLPFKHDQILMTDTINKIKHTEILLRNSKYSSILSEKIQKALYENVDGASSNEFIYGVYSAGEISLLDNIFLAYGDEDPNLWLHVIIVVHELYDTLNTLITEADQHSQTVIDRQISTIVAVLVVFIVISFFMYFVIYLRFFNEEKKSLHKMHTIMEIMP